MQLFSFYSFLYYKYSLFSKIILAKDVNITYISKQANIYMNIRDFQYQILYIIGKHPVNIHLGGFIS